MRVLIINSYAGSITLAAKTLGCDIIGSYEDHNFGLDIQKHNIPGLNYIPHVDDWPEQDLSDALLIAHPPCSAFSVQNCSPTARGVDSNAFACTKRVLDYGAHNKAAVIAIESVMGALAGAWDIHQHFADTNDYHVYRILENGCMFGAQWRERFWVVFVKKNTAFSDTFHLRLAPAYKTVGEVIDGWEDGDSAGNQDRLLEDQKERLVTEAHLTPDEMSFFFDPQDPPHPTKALGTLLYEKKFKTPESTSADKWDCFQQYIGGFASGTMVYLDPFGTAPTLMGGSFWYVNGRCVSENAFKRIMGFPGSYEFPSTPRNFKGQIRMYLSKGVMPPIAEWVIRQIFRHMGEPLPNATGTLSWAPTHEAYNIALEPNHIADFRIKKDDWWFRDKQLPPLRLMDRKPDVTGGLSFETPKPQRVPREKRERAPRTISRGRLSDIRVEVVSVDLPGSTITDQRRRAILDVIKELGTPTHHEAIEASIQRPNIQILPTTAHWHIRQLIKGGQLKEVAS